MAARVAAIPDPWGSLLGQATPLGEAAARLARM
jgi:hypothetical protein